MNRLTLLLLIVLFAAAPCLVRGDTPAPVFVDPVWSPDGGRIAFHSDANGDFDVYVYDLAAGNVQRLTQDPGDDRWPAWSPEGTRLVFSAERDGESDLYLMTAGGMILERLTDTGGLERHPQWTRDGRSLLFDAVNPPASRRAVWRLDLVSGQPIRMSSPDVDSQRPGDCGPDWLFQSDRDGGDRIYRHVGSGAEAVMIGEPGGAHSDPDCGPLSGRIAHVRQQPGGEADIWVMAPDGRAAQALTAGDGGDDRAPAWSPDEQWIVYSSSRDGQTSLYVVPAGGGASIPMTGFKPGD